MKVSTSLALVAAAGIGYVAGQTVTIRIDSTSGECGSACPTGQDLSELDYVGCEVSLQLLEGITGKKCFLSGQITFTGPRSSSAACVAAGQDATAFRVLLGSAMSAPHLESGHFRPGSSIEFDLPQPSVQVCHWYATSATEAAAAQPTCAIDLAGFDMSQPQQTIAAGVNQLKLDLSSQQSPRDVSFINDGKIKEDCGVPTGNIRYDAVWEFGGAPAHLASIALMLVTCISWLSW